MAVADPAGLLTRIPELEALVGDNRVKRAIERGDPLGLYRVLWWGQRFGRFAKHRDLVESLLPRRRLFIAPIRSAPSLFTYNGIGTTAYGRDDVDVNDGTYVLTHVVAVFFVPIFPLGQFLVRDGEQSGPRRSWSFIGKVPLGSVVYAWNRSLALFAVLSVVVSMLSVWQSSRYHEVHVVNGLNVPIRATIANHKVEVASKSHGVVTVHVGTLPVAVERVDGRPIETAELDVPSGGKRVVLWNVLGAAPVYRETIVYAKNPTNDEPETTIGCGEERIVYEDVADLWVDPPKEMSMSSSTSEVSRGHVGLAAGGVNGCAGYLADKGHLPQAAELARRAAVASDYDDDTTSLAASLINDLRGADEALIWAHTALQARPNSVELHRTYQTYATRLGKRAEILPEYKARYAMDASSPDSGYLLARLESPAESVALLDELTRRFPNHIASRRAHAFNEFQLGHFKEAIVSWTALRKLDRADWLVHFPLFCRAMVAIGSTSEALGEVDSEYAQKDASHARLAELYAEIAVGLDQKNGEKLLNKLKDEVSASRLTWLRVEAGLPVQPSEVTSLDPPTLRDAAAIFFAARTAPDIALEKASHASTDALRPLSEAVWTLLYAEALRREPGGSAAQALAKAPQLSPAEMQSVAGFLKTGTVDDELAEANYEVRAAAEFARSRMPSLPASERRALVARARQDDLLHGAVTAAIDGWKP